MKPREEKRPREPVEPEVSQHADDHKERVGRRRYDALIFLAIVACAFGLRLIYILQLRDSPLFDTPSMDALYHDQWAQAIAGGETFIEGPYFRAPLYPALLGLIYKVAGHDYFLARIVQALLGSLSCGLVFLVGRSVFSRSVGAVAGFAAATYWMLVYFDAELLIPVLVVFLDLVMILLLLWAGQRPSWLSYGLAGLALGLSAIARPNVLLFAPAVVIWPVIRHRSAWRRAVVYAAGFAVGCLLPVLPVTLRNYVVGDDFVLVASQGGVNFYIGNNPDSDGHTAIVPGTPGDWWGGYYASIARAEAAVGHPLKPSEVSNYYFGQAVAFFRDQPGAALGLMGRKLWLFWNAREVSNNQGIYFWTERFTPLIKWLPLSFALVGPLGLLGLVLCWRRRAELFPIWGFVLVYMISVVLFFSCARYRVPVLGPLILLGVYAVFHLVEVAWHRQWGTLARQLIVLVAAAGLVNAVPARAESRNDARDLRQLGIAYRRKGRLEDALVHFRAAVRADPNRLSARNSLALTLLQLGRDAEAEQQLRLAVALASDLGPGETPALVASVHHTLANLLRKHDRREEAIVHYRRAIESDTAGGEARTFLRLGNTLAEMGRLEAAADALSQAVARDPHNPAARHSLGRALANSARLDEAAVHFRQALRLDPGQTRTWYALGRILLAQGHADEAIHALRQSVRTGPQNVSAADELAGALIREARYAEAIDLLTDAVALQDATLTNNLAWLLATCPDDELRDGPRAVRHAQTLCPHLAECPTSYLDTLAAALAEAGQFDQAVQVARQALQSARAAGDDPLAQALATRLELYESNQPYHEPR